MKQVLVFRTSVSASRAVDRLRPLLNQRLGRNWSFDLEDWEQIFRVETDLAAEKVARFLREEGFECEELGDEVISSQ